MVEFFSGLVANKLANELLKFAAPRLRDRFIGSDEERALGRAFQRAFSAMLEEVAEPTSPELAGELESQLDRFVTDQEVANALLDIAIERRKPPVGQLRARFEELGFDPETFLTDFDRAINSFAFQLTDELRKEAAKSQSALFNQVTMAEFDSLREQLQEVLERLDRTDDKHLTTFVNTALPMPPNFVPRREELNELRQAVIGNRDTALVTLTGLRGMGGIGKTALAIALCHDDGLQEIFPDGVVWVDIGREPGNLAGKMRRVGQALGDRLGYYDTPEAGTDRLRLFLKDKAVLLVLDDVWDARHVEPFIVEAPRCRVLFTTRNADIALGLDAREIPLDVLAPEQAVSLLREWAKRDDPALPDIGKRLGNLPLALKLAGARLRGGMSGAEWLETFQHVSQIKLSRRSTDPQENLLVSFELSVGDLPAEDRRLYYALGIFPEDVRAPQSVVGRLWRQLSPELSQFDCDELVTELAQLALIERNAADDKTVTLHDLLREYTHEQLGDELAATQNALLSAYNPEGKPWPQIEHGWLSLSSSGLSSAGSRA